jgi:anti-sigma B factor antagonist
MSPAPCLLTRQEVGAATVVRFTGENVRLHEEKMRRIGPELNLLLAEVGRRRVVLDFGNVTYLTSTALGKFVGLHSRLQALGGSLALFNVRPEIYEVFALTRLDTILELHNSDKIPDLEMN